MIKIHHLYHKNISLNHRKLAAKSQENKMEIEVAISNQIIGSVATQDSNNTKSSMEPKNINICYTNMIFFHRTIII